MPHDTYAAARNAEYTFPSPLYVSLIAAYACLICNTRPVTRAKVAKQLCRDWRAHMPTAQQHGEHAVVHYRECSDTDMMCVACRP